MVRINSVDYRGSICDGPGIRTVVFFQGCEKKCLNCHNPSTWDVTVGVPYDEKLLAEEIEAMSYTKKVTISGGEPLLQIDGLRGLLKELKKRGFNIVLYTGYEFGEVPPDIVALLDYIKVGKYEESLRSTVLSYIGSTNQKFIKI